MIFFLASLPNTAYKVYHSIAHTDGKGKIMNKAGIKGFQFKGLRGLTPSDVLNILQMVEKGELKLNEVNGYSHDLKVLEKIKESFIQRVGAKDWGDAKERFKEFTSEKNLSALFGKKFNPEAASFIDYCSRAAKYASFSMINGTLLTFLFIDTTVRQKEQKRMQMLHSSGPKRGGIWRHFTLQK